MRHTAIYDHGEWRKSRSMRASPLAVGIPHLVIAFVAWASSTSAQVNTEALRGDAFRKGLSGRVEGTFTGSTGNSQGVVSGGNARLQLKSNTHLAFVHSAGAYSRLNSTTSVERAVVHARYNYEVASWIWGEVFSQIEHDAFRRLTNREIVGIGLRFHAFRTEDVDLYYGTAYMAEWENLNLVDNDPDDRLTFAHRWSNYIAVSASLTDRLEAGATLYFQPRFDRFSDWRLLQESFLEVGITGFVSTKVSVVIRHDSDPPASVKKTDLSVTNAFVAKF